MALEYDLTNVAESTKEGWRDESLPDLERDYQWAVAEAIIFWMMALGMSEITEDNVAEWWARYLIANNTGERLLTLAHVEGMIGLKVNVAYEPTSKWLKRVYAVELVESQNKVKRFREAQRKV